MSDDQPEPLTASVRVMMSPTERRVFEAEARRIGVKVSTWLRLTARKATRMMEVEK